MSRPTSRLAAITSAILGVSVLSVAAPAFGGQNEVPESRPIRDWVAVQSLPAAFQGRWAQMHLGPEGQLVSSGERCRRGEVETADLVLGTDWFVNGSVSGFLIDIEFSQSEQVARLTVVYNNEGDVRIGPELFSLSANGTRLGVATNPELGWEVSNYSKC